MIFLIRNFKKLNYLISGRSSNYLIYYRSYSKKESDFYEKDQEECINGVKSAENEPTILITNPTKSHSKNKANSSSNRMFLSKINDQVIKSYKSQDSPISKKSVDCLLDDKIDQNSNSSNDSNVENKPRYRDDEETGQVLSRNNSITSKFSSLRTKLSSSFKEPLDHYKTRSRMNSTNETLSYHNLEVNEGSTELQTFKISSIKSSSPENNVVV